MVKNIPKLKWKILNLEKAYYILSLIKQVKYTFDNEANMQNKKKVAKLLKVKVP